MGSKKQKAYRSRLQRQVVSEQRGHNSEGNPQKLDTDRDPGRGLFYGYKGQKPANEKRPFKGGKVHWVRYE